MGDSEAPAPSGSATCISLACGPAHTLAIVSVRDAKGRSPPLHVAPSPLPAANTPQWEAARSGSSARADALATPRKQVAVASPPPRGSESRGSPPSAGTEEAELPAATRRWAHLTRCVLLADAHQHAEGGNWHMVAVAEADEVYKHHAEKHPGVHMERMLHDFDALLSELTTQQRQRRSLIAARKETEAILTNETSRR